DIRQTSTLVIDAMAASVARRKPSSNSTILHSDHGAQFTSWTFAKRLRDAGSLGSMGTVGDCFDNAMMESFWGTMQLELLDTKKWLDPRTITHARVQGVGAPRKGREDSAADARIAVGTRWPQSGPIR
ncbi:hypothetical protein E1298_28710, partial [Actinomadura rubrisoli]